jgi:hypothetical protein
MGGTEIALRVDGANVADSNVFAAELKEQLHDQLPDAKIETRRERADAQDFGATLVLVLGTPAIIALAKGISMWLAQRAANDAPPEIEIKTKKGTLKVKHVPGKDVRAIIEKGLEELV